MVEAQALPPQTTNHQAELEAFTCTFQLTKGQSLNLWMDYAFHILLSLVATWEERGLPTTKENSTTNSDQVTALLEASHFPTSIGIVQVSGA